MRMNASHAARVGRPKSILVALLCVALVGCTPQPRPVTVLTRNFYFGFPEGSLIAAGSIEALALAVEDGWLSVVDTDFPERARALADEVEATLPDIIGIQEAATYLVQSPGDLLTGGDVPATEVVYDYLRIFMEELERRGLSYSVVASLDEMDVELPSANGDDVRLIDRDVILARTGAASNRLAVLSTDSGHFETLLELPVGGEGGPTISLLRGWVSVDVRVDGQSFRFVNTHLDDYAPVQEAQALELLAGPLDSPLPAILLGDLNSDAFGGGTATYGLLLDAGFSDAWVVARGSDPGLTWGHDADLRNPAPTLSQRLDLILYRGGFVAEDAEVLGDEPDDRTESGLWPSDHAGVVARLGLPTPRAR